MLFNLLYLIFCKFLLVISKSEVLNRNDRDIKDAILGTLLRIPMECTAVVFYDDVISGSIIYNLVQGIHLEERVVLTLDLSYVKLNTFKSNGTSEIIKMYLRNLYLNGKCYVFIVWLKDPEILYPNFMNIHPGWRMQDYVILAVHDEILLSYKKIIYLRIWKEIPNIVGLKKKEIKANRIMAFTVIPNYKNGQRKSQELDIWIVKQKQFEKNSSLFIDKFNTFNGGILRIGIICKPPFLIFGDQENPYLDGLDWRLTSIAVKKLKYLYYVKYAEKTGTLLENGTWTGIMSYLMNGEIDFAIGGITISPNRLKYFNFCKTYYTDAYTFISPLQTTNPSVWNALTKPFKPEVWTALAITLSFATICMKFIALMERKLGMMKSHYQKDLDNYYFTNMAVNIGFMFCAFCQKSFFYIPKTTPLKLAYIGVSISLFILGIIFGGRMFSMILYIRQDVSIDKIEDLENSGIPVDVKNYDGYLNEHIKTTRNGILWNTINLVAQNMSLDSMDEVVQGNRAYIDSRSSLDFTARYFYKGAVGFKFHLSSEDIVVGKVGWAIRKNWPYQKAFDKIITGAVEGGLVDYWMSNFKQGKFGWDTESLRLDNNYTFLPTRQRRTKEIDPTLNLERKDIKLELDNFIGVGVLWVLGISISFTVFLGELILGWKNLWVTKTCQKKPNNKILLINKQNMSNLRKQLLKFNSKNQERPPQLSIVWADFDKIKTLNLRQNKTLNVKQIKNKPKLTRNE